MSLSKKQPEELFGVQNTMKDLLPKEHEMAVFSREIYPLFSDHDFKDCYSDKGRNAIPPSFLAMVTLLQWRESLSDEETAEAVYLRLDWKYALHLPLEKEGLFDSSTLCVFRRRLKEKDKESVVFDKLVNLCREKGFIKKNTKQRIDATHIVKHINRITTTDLLFRAVKCLVEEIEEKHAEYYEKKIPEDIKARYEGKFSCFGMSKETRADRQAEIVEDGLRLKRILAQEAFSSELKQLEIMETIFGENVVIREKKIEEKTFIEVEEIECPKQTVFEPRDPTVQLGVKGKTKWVGEKCHIVETAEKGEINFIVDMIPQKAQESDQRIHSELQERNEEKGFHPEKIYGDQNYISGTAIKTYAQQGQILMGYAQADTSKKEEGFRVADFDIDMEKKEAVCPAGKVCINWHYRKKTKSYHICYSKSQCRDCRWIGKCVTDTRGKRILRVSEDYEFIEQRRKKQKTREFRKEMSVRAQVEGTISELVRKHGIRKARYKGQEGRALQYYMAACALNLRRFVKRLSIDKK